MHVVTRVHGLSVHRHHHQTVVKIRNNIDFCPFLCIFHGARTVGTLQLCSRCACTQGSGGLPCIWMGQSDAAEQCCTPHSGCTGPREVQDMVQSHPCVSYCLQKDPASSILESVMHVCGPMQSGQEAEKTWPQCQNVF